jgi:cytochrome P450
VNHSQFNIVSPRFKASPFPLLANLRASQPVCRTTPPDKTPVWLLTRYEDVATLLKDDRFVKDKRKAMTAEQLRKMPWVPPMFRSLERNMLDLDPPDHTRCEPWCIRLLHQVSSHACVIESSRWLTNYLRK